MDYCRYEQVLSKHRSYSGTIFTGIGRWDSEEQVETLPPSIQSKLKMEGTDFLTSVPTVSVSNMSLYTNYAIQSVSLPSFESSVSWDDLSKNYKFG